MPRTTFAPENKANETTERYPKLKLAKDERGRIVCVEDPIFEFVHSLKAPKIINGEPLIEVKKRKDGTTYEEYEKEFIGQPICSGDLGILQGKGVDAKNCPACEASTRSDAVPGPIRRYAMNVVQYGIRPGGWELAAPFSVRIVIWAFTARIFDQLVDFTTEWGSLREHDMLLGPCEDANFQKWPFKLAKDAMWMYNADTKNAVKIAWQSRATQKQLEDACGRRATMEFFKDDVNRTEQRWSMARRAGAAGSAVQAGSLVQPAGLAQGLDGLLDSSTAPPQVEQTVPAAAPVAPAADPFGGDPFGGDPQAQPASPATAAPVADPFGQQPAPPTTSAPASPPASVTPVTEPVQPAAASVSPSDPFGATPSPDPAPAAPSTAPAATPAAPAAATPAPATASTPAPAAQQGADVSFDELLG